MDASHEKFHGPYLDTLKAELDALGRKIDYIVVSHTEPDHSGLIPAVLDLYPEATVAGSKVGLGGQRIVYVDLLIYVDVLIC